MHTEYQFNIYVFFVKNVIACYYCFYADLYLYACYNSLSTTFIIQFVNDWQTISITDDVYLVMNTWLYVTLEELPVSSKMIEDPNL